MVAVFTLGVVAVFSRLEGMLGGLLMVPFAVFWAIVSYAIGVSAKAAMYRRRIWLWARYKFNTWEDLHDWLVLTSPEDIEWAMNRPENSWEPDVENGGFLIK